MRNEARVLAYILANMGPSMHVNQYDNHFLEITTKYSIFSKVIYTIYKENISF